MGHHHTCGTARQALQSCSGAVPTASNKPPWHQDGQSCTPQRPCIRRVSIFRRQNSPRALIRSPSHLMLYPPRPRSTSAIERGLYALMLSQASSHRCNVDCQLQPVSRFPSSDRADCVNLKRQGHLPSASCCGQRGAHAIRASVSLPRLLVWALASILKPLTR